MPNMVEILISAKDLAGPALARARADVVRLQAESERQSAAAAASANRRRALETERERLFAAEQASLARRAAGETTAAQRAAEREQIALARRANQQQIAAARTAEREQVASARRASRQMVAAQREQVAGAKAAAGKMRGAFEGMALATAVVGVESIKMASKFDASMALLVTQAGVAKGQMGTLKKGVLDLAGKVGQDPDSLAESLFHVESNFESVGISSSKALKLTETAAKGATLGHADLVDVTNALTAAVASGIPGVKNFDQAMGALNATVGTGDMKMQDLASAFSSGMVATVAGFGLSIKDVGAALATFGDNNIRGSLAGNQLRMSVMALAKPVATAHDALKKLGLTQTTLSNDMQKGGLKLAMEDLVDRLHKAGISSKEQGQIITDAFGRKAGSGLNVLVREFDKFESKYPALTEGANKFGTAWDETKKTFAFQTKAMKGELESLGIQLGVKLMPIASKFLSFLTDVSKNSSVKSVLKTMSDEGGAAFDALAGGLKLAAPFLTELAHGFQAIMEFGTPFISEMGRVGSAIADALFPAKGGQDLGGPFTRFLAMVRENKGSLQEMARGFANGVIDMTEVTLQNLPMITGAFRTMADAALISLGAFIDGMAKMFGDVPLIGDKLKNAAKGFDSFRDSAMHGMAKADKSVRDLAHGSLPKLEKARLKLNIDDWSSQIKTAKSQLSKVPPSKRSALRAEISDLEAKVARARRDLASIDGQTATVRIMTQYFTAKNPAQLAAAHGRAHGGPIRLAGGGDPGGRVSGPGTETSDSIPALLSDGEYVIRAAAVRKYGERFMDALNSGSLRVSGFARGGTTKAEREARSQAMGQLTISHFGQMAGYGRSEFGSALGKAGSLSDLVNALNQWRGIIKAATHGGQERSLLKALDSSGKRLLGWEKQLTKVSASLEKAKTKLDDLKSSASQLADSVKSGILSSASITRNTGEGPVTVSSIMGGLTQSRDKATALSSALAQLKKKGLSASLLQQIAEAGIEGGGLDTAGALLGASGSELQSINSMQSQINKAAGSAGKTTSDAMYGAAIKAQTATVKTLTHSQDRLKSSMDKLAKSMEKLVEKAFKGKAAGGIAGAAASGGLRSDLTWVGEHGPELLDLPAGSRVWSNPDSRRKLAAAAAPWTSMLNSPRRPSSGGGVAGKQEVHVVLHVEATNSHDYNTFLVNEIRKAVRARGSIEATFKPPRGR